MYLMKYKALLFLIGLMCLSALPLSSPPTLQVHAATRPHQAHAIPLTGSWTTTGNMLTGRGAATATLLTTGPHAGDVLVSGGQSNNGATILSSAELYDPANGTWSATGSMHAARTRYTATLLPNGQVLVAGGLGSDIKALSSAELYDPTTGSWSTTGPMHDARLDQTATLLSNGQVLVSGGLGNSFAAINSAELYNPATGSWSATNSMNTAREFHTATLLNNDQVLVAGGKTAAGSVINSAELYNPATGSWSTTGALNTARWQHTATLLQNGQVLVAGGRDTAGSAINSAELYNPATGSWSTTGALNTARNSFTATLLNSGQILATGGDSSTNAALSSAELYNPIRASWSAIGSMHTARSFYTATLLNNGQVLVAGSLQSGLNSAEVFAFAPQLNLPANITVDATGPNGAIVNYAATIKPNRVKMNYAVAATDPDSGKPLPVTCNPPSGSTFPIGTTTVTCSAKLPPPASLVTSGSFTIAVEGAPVLHLPANITVDATSPHGAVVTYSATATDPNTGKPVPVTCTPASGSTFPIGKTIVWCSAQKSPTLVTKGSFTVTVKGATDQIKALIALVKSFKFNFLVQETLNVHLQVALAGVKGHLNILVRSQLDAFITQVRAYQATGQISASQASQLITAAQQIQNVLD
jgi:N-acetylneuraminic acid mutarotase